MGRLRYACLVVGALLAAAAAAQGPLGLQRGMLLEEAIAELERNGLTVFYSSDLIKPWSRVNVVPSAAEPATALREILDVPELPAMPAVPVVRDPSSFDEQAPGRETNVIDLWSGWGRQP